MILIRLLRGIEEIDNTHEPVTTTTDLPVPESVTHGASNSSAVPASCTQNRKRGSNTHGESLRHTGPKGCANCMDEFAEKILY